MIRILHFVSIISINSGVMSFIMNYYRNINRENVQFDFLCWSKGDDIYVDEIKSLGGNIYYIPKPGLSKKYQKEIIEFFKSKFGVYSILHLHEVFLNMFIPPIARKYGIQHTIAHSHATMYSDKKLSALRNFILCLPIKKMVNHYFACSKDAGYLVYGKKYVDQGKVKIINNAIDCEKFQYNEDTRMKIRKDMKLEDMFVIGHVGRFNPQKNHMFLIDIFYEVSKQKQNSMLMLVGEGPLQEQVEEKIKEKNLSDRVLILNNRNDICDLLQAIDVFVLPSIYEGLGIVLIEAQASGLKCYATDIVPCEAKVTEELAYISLKESAFKWANAIIEGQSNFKRQNEIKRVHEAGYDIKTEAEKLERIYFSISKEGKRFIDNTYL